jgi:hypothetical protein
MQNQNDNDFQRYAQRLETGVIKVQKGLLNPIEKFLNWQPWELFTHLAMVALFAYVLYALVVSPKERTITNLLLLLIAVSLALQVQQNINIKANLNL